MVSSPDESNNIEVVYCLSQLHQNTVIIFINTINTIHIIVIFVYLYNFKPSRIIIVFMN